MTDALPARSRFALRDVLGVVLVGGFMAVLGLLFGIAIPKTNEQLITYMLGQLSGFVGAVVAFHYTLNSLNEKATANTGEMLRTMRAQALARDGARGEADPLPRPAFGETP